VSLVKKEELRFGLGVLFCLVGSARSARSAPMKNNDDINTIDTSEITHLINSLKQGELDKATGY
jgi:hypothetical protein